MKISIVFVGLSLLSKKKQRKNGTHVPGPFDMKWVVWRRLLRIRVIAFKVDLSVVRMDVQ